VLLILACGPGAQVNSRVLEKSLTESSFQTNLEKVTKPLTAQQALDGRDAFVKVTDGSQQTGPLPVEDTRCRSMCGI